MMKTTSSTPPASTEHIPVERAAFFDLLRRRPITGIERVLPPSNARRRAVARAMAEIRSYVVKSLPGEATDTVVSYDELRNDVEGGVRR